MTSIDPPGLIWAPVSQINLNGTCTKLYFGGLAIRNWGINPMQLSLFLTTATFLLFLILRIPCSISSIRNRPNSISKIYYILVWTSTLMCSLRILLVWFVWKEISLGAEVIWVAQSSIFFMLEVSVFVFLFSSDVSSANKLLKRVGIVTAITTAVFVIAQSIVVFAIKIRIYDYTPLSLYWWGPFNAVRALAYLFIVILPIVPCRHGIHLPTRKSFYAYVFSLLIFHIIESIGVILIFTENRSVGFCFIDTSLIGYFSFYSPLLYLLFLKDYFHPERVSLMQSPVSSDYEYEPING